MIQRSWHAFMPVVILTLVSPHAALSDEHGNAEVLVKDYFAQFQKPGFLVDQLMEFYADEIIFVDPTFEIAARGKEEVRKLYAELGTERTAYKNIVWTIKSVIAQDDNIVVRGNWSGQFHQCSFSIEFMTLWRMKAGKIAEQNDFFAASTFDRQVGWNGSTATCQSQSSE
jgi:ketosteroid isomerase-like protein